MDDAEVDNKKDFDVEQEPLLFCSSSTSRASPDFVTAADLEIKMLKSKIFVSTRGWDSNMVVSYKIDEEFHRMSLLDCDTVHPAPHPNLRQAEIAKSKTPTKEITVRFLMKTSNDEMVSSVGCGQDTGYTCRDNSWEYRQVWGKEVGNGPSGAEEPGREDGPSVGYGNTGEDHIRSDAGGSRNQEVFS